MQTYDPRIYAVGECVEHRGIAYGLVAPLFEQAKVCANHLAHFGIGRYHGSVTSTKLKVTGIDVFSAGDFSGKDAEEIVLHDRQGGVYKRILLKDNRDRRQRALRRHGRRRLVLPAAEGQAGRARHPRPPDVRPEPSRRRRPQGRDAGRGHAGHRAGVRLQRRMQGRHRQGDQDPRPVLPSTTCASTPRPRVPAVRAPVWSSRSSPRASAAPTCRRTRRPSRCAAAPTTRTTKCAQAIREKKWLSIPGGDAGHGLAHAQRLRLLPAGAQLLPGQHLAARGEGRSAVALHQRARARQHPEGRHLLRGAAHVGRTHHAAANCAPSPMPPRSTRCPR